MNAGPAASRFAAKDAVTTKATQARTALGEVTLTAVNRKVRMPQFNHRKRGWLTFFPIAQDPVSKLASGKDKEEVGLKRGRSNSTTLAQRVPLGPGRASIAPPVAHPVNARVPLARVRVPPVHSNVRRSSRPAPEPIVMPEDEEIHDTESHHEMDVEEDTLDQDAEHEANLLAIEQEVEAMVGVEDSDEENEVEETALLSAKEPRMWPEVATERALRYQKEVQSIREAFEDEVDMFDTTMVSEYAEEIFEYMCELEVGF